MCVPCCNLQGENRCSLDAVKTIRRYGITLHVNGKLWMELSMVGSMRGIKSSGFQALMDSSITLEF